MQATESHLFRANKKLESKILKLEKKVLELEKKAINAKNDSGYEVRWNRELCMENEKLHKIIDTAWGIIANAWNGDWNKSAEDWRKAAENWRNRYFDL